MCLQSGHSAVWDRSEGGGCAADTGLPRLKEDMPDADEGRAFLVISLLSTREITSLSALSRMALVHNTSRRMSKSEQNYLVSMSLIPVPLLICIEIYAVLFKRTSYLEGGRVICEANNS